MLTDFHGDEAQNLFFLEKKSKWHTQKNWDFQFPQFSIFFRKNSGIGSGLVGLIDGKGIDVAQPIRLRDCPT